jgi:hypothetical protein
LRRSRNNAISFDGASLSTELLAQKYGDSLMRFAKPQ